MRVALVCADPGVPFGSTKGGSVHLGEVATALAAEGADVLVLAAAAAGPPPSDVQLDLLPGAWKGTPVGGRLAAEPLTGRWLEERLRAFGADVVYERFALHTAAAARAARALGVPHVVELNAPLVQEASRYRTLAEPEAARRLEREVLSAAAMVFAVSPPLAAHAHAHGARRVEVLPNAVALERFRAPHFMRTGRPTAVFSGTLRPWHGIECIAAAWRRLGSSAPSLLVVGDGPGREVLESVGARVTGAVPPEEVPALLGEADIGLAPFAADAPSYFSPLKLFEYLAAGLAAVAGDLPGVVGVVDAHSAVVIPRGDADALAAAVARLSADADLRARLGAHGRELVEREHTWRHRAARILQTADELRAVAA